jgi:hypothetical protein
MGSVADILAPVRELDTWNMSREAFSISKSSSSHAWSQAALLLLSGR